MYEMYHEETFFVKTSCLPRYCKFIPLEVIFSDRWSLLLRPFFIESLSKNLSFNVWWLVWNIQQTRKYFKYAKNPFPSLAKTPWKLSPFFKMTKSVRYSGIFRYRYDDSCNFDIHLLMNIWSPITYQLKNIYSNPFIIESFFKVDI